MTREEMHMRMELLFQNVGSFAFEDFLPEEKDIYLNKAQKTLVENIIKLPDKSIYHRESLSPIFKVYDSKVYISDSDYFFELPGDYHHFDSLVLRTFPISNKHTLQTKTYSSDSVDEDAVVNSEEYNTSYIDVQDFLKASENTDKLFIYINATKVAELNIYPAQSNFLVNIISQMNSAITDYSVSRSNEAITDSNLKKIVAKHSLALKDYILFYGNGSAFDLHVVFAKNNSLENTSRIVGSKLSYIENYGLNENYNVKAKDKNFYVVDNSSSKYVPVNLVNNDSFSLTGNNPFRTSTNDSMLGVYREGQIDIKPNIRSIVTTGILSYYIKPVEIGSTLDNNEKADCQLPEFVHDTIVTLAVESMIENTANQRVKTFSNEVQKDI